MSTPRPGYGTVRTSVTARADFRQPQKIYMRMSGLEMERQRLLSEWRRAVRTIAMCEARCGHIEQEITALREALDTHAPMQTMRRADQRDPKRVAAGYCESKAGRQRPTAFRHSY